MFNIHGTAFKTGNFELRLWKGWYGPFAGSGGEIGLYNKNGTSMNRKQLEDLGLKSTKLEVYRKDDDSEVAQYSEKKPSFWTTSFNLFNWAQRGSVYSKNTFEFETEEQATDFYNQITNTDVEKKAESYFQNKGKDQFDITQDKNTVTIIWGKEDEK